jgi:hypothetical protein
MSVWNVVATGRGLGSSSAMSLTKLLRKNSRMEWFMHLHLAADSRTIADMGTSFLERFILGDSSQDPTASGFYLSPSLSARHYIAWLEVNGPLRQMDVAMARVCLPNVVPQGLESRPGRIG